MTPHIHMQFGLCISVEKELDPETMLWAKENTIRWMPATLLSGDCYEARKFHAQLGEAILFAEMLSIMTDEKLFKLAYKLAAK